MLEENPRIKKGNGKSNRRERRTWASDQFIKKKGSRSSELIEWCLEKSIKRLWRCDSTVKQLWDRSIFSDKREGDVLSGKDQTALTWYRGHQLKK